MPSINYNVELKRKWTRHCVLSAAGADSDDANFNNIIFTIKDTKLFVPVVTLSEKDNQKLSKLLRKGFERSVYWNEYKTKNENKNATNEYRYFLESNFFGVNRLFVLVYSNQGTDSKRFKTRKRKYYLPKGIIDNYNAIISGKNCYDQAMYSDIKRYVEIRKLTTGQSEDYTTGCLLHYDHIKNYYRLIAVELSRQKELDADLKVNQQIKLIRQLKKLNDDNNNNNVESMFILTILEKIKEAR